MKYEDDQLIIYYNECDKDYISRMIEIIAERKEQILSFFHIDYTEKITIKLYDDIDKYKENLLESFKKEATIKSIKEGQEIEPRKYQDFMIANTEDGNINMQSLCLVKTKEEYQNYTEEEFLYNVCHEFTHLCQQKVGSNSPGWFWEVLATVLGNPECQHETKDPIVIQDLDYNFDQIDGYGAAYKIGKYLFSNYDSDFILSLVYDTDKLYQTANEIMPKINETKEDTRKSL